MNIAFRVDASTRIGTGHFMRCLTLADAIKERGGSSRFLSRNLPDHLRGLLDSRGHTLLPLGPGDGSADGGLAHSAWLGTSQQADARECIEALHDLTCDWLIVDHYALDERWETPLRQRAKNIFVIDDIADRNHDCDLLLDQNFYADMETRYCGKLPRGCHSLLGPSFALLRQEFVQQRIGLPPRSGLPRRVLVFFGGIDASNLTGQTLEALTCINKKGLHVDVVIGHLHPFRNEISEICVPRKFSCHVETARMAELMAAADLAIGAGGTAVLERFCLGLPTFAIPTAENQMRQIRDLAGELLLYSPESENNPALNIECHLRALFENPSLLNAMSRSCMQTVDGRGTERVIGYLEGAEIKMREAHQNDSEDIFRWRNHPTVRAASTNDAPIPWPEHEAWFAQTLASPDRPLLVGMLAGHPVGVVRFDISDRAAEVSIYRVPDSKGNGLGAQLLDQAERWLAAHRPGIVSLKAVVLGNNKRSKTLFSRAGYNVETTHFTKSLHAEV